MKSPLIALLASALLLAACGDDSENNTPDNTADEPTDDGSQDSEHKWMVSVSGGDEELTPASGGSVLVVASDSSASVTGQDYLKGSSMAITFGTGISVGDVVASETSIVFKEPDYRCVSLEMTVSFTSIDPAVGSFAGAVSCTAQGGAAGAFEATATGEFEG